MKKKVLLIVIPIIIILTAVIFLFTMNNDKKHIDYSIDLLREGLNYLGKRNYKTSGTLDVTAKYKGAHGEHYPGFFNYLFETNLENGIYTVSIGNKDGYVTKQYELELFELVQNLKEVNTTKLDYVNYKKVNDTYELDIDVINDALSTDFKKCTIDVTSTGILKDFESSTIKCDDNLTIELTEKRTTINYYDNVIKIDKNENGFSLNMNDLMKMNTFYENDKSRHNIVIGDDVFYVEAMDNKLFLSVTSQAAIYNGMEITVTYKDIVLNKINNLEEIEIPIFRYFNEYKFNYWRDINE